MPKIIPITEKWEWLQDYEQGKSEAAIASLNHRDLRIIKKGIEEARRERVVNLAKVDLVKEAIRNNNTKMLGKKAGPYSKRGCISHQIAYSVTCQ